MTLTAMPATAVLDREFLEIRAKLLELAASFDRLDRGDGETGGDPRTRLIFEALAVLHSDGGNRAERVQLIFSREYDDRWREAFDI